MNKCIGCGSVLQTLDSNKEGFVRNQHLNNQLCERCFRIKIYGEYKDVNKDNVDFEAILNDISKTNDLVILVVDIFNLNKDINSIIEKLNNEILLVLTKRDLLPLSVSNEKLINYTAFNNKKVIDKVIVSSNKNYGLDELMGKISLYKKSSNVYVVGYTNAGKSTLINKLIYNYSDLNTELTTSMYSSTTLNKIEIKFDDELTIIDTPGIVDNGNILELVDSKMMKRIIPKKEIKTVVYQVKTPQTIFIDNLVRIDIENNNNLVFYMSNELGIERLFKQSDKLLELKKTVVRVKENCDIVILGLGFIKVSNSDTISIYTLDGVEIYSRPSLI